MFSLSLRIRLPFVPSEIAIYLLHGLRWTARLWEYYGMPPCVRTVASPRCVLAPQERLDLQGSATGPYGVLVGEASSSR